MPAPNYQDGSRQPSPSTNNGHATPAGRLQQTRIGYIGTAAEKVRGRKAARLHRTGEIMTLNRRHRTVTLEKKNRPGHSRKLCFKFMISRYGITPTSWFSSSVIGRARRL